MEAIYLFSIWNRSVTNSSPKSKDENPVSVIDYWLKSVIVIGIAGWPKSSIGFGNRVAG
jgi:hypothetical protein